MSDTEQPTIRLRGVAKRFGHNQVLEDVTLDVFPGQHMALIGNAASGKTVLLKCIVGLHRIDKGSIEIEGREISRLSTSDQEEMLDKFGVLFQRSALFDSQTVWENITFKRLNRGHVKRRVARNLAIEKLRQVGLKPETADLFPADLSGGMQKRVALARAIMEEPDILLLDDPTAGLDPILTRVINQLIGQLADEAGATILSVTSDMDAMRRDYDQTAMLHDGQIIWTGATADIEAADNPYLAQLVHGRAEGPIKMRVRSPDLV